MTGTQSPIPWGTIGSVLGGVILVVTPLVWWLVGEIKSLRQDFIDIVTGKSKTADGKAIKIINGVQDEKLQDLNERIKTNSEEIKKIWEVIRGIKTVLKKFTENQEGLQKTWDGLLEASTEMISAMHVERKESKEYLEGLGESILSEIKRQGGGKE